MKKKLVVADGSGRVQWCGHVWKEPEDQALTLEILRGVILYMLQKLKGCVPARLIGDVDGCITMICLGSQPGWVAEYTEMLPLDDDTWVINFDEIKERVL